MMQAATTLASAISRGISFIKRQQRDWKITVVRSSLNGFFQNIENPYRSIFIRALGATGTQLGTINSIGALVSGLVAPFVGWSVDRIGIKRIYLIGICLGGVSYLVYGLAQNWTVIIAAMILSFLGMTASMQSCMVICGNCLVSQERATGMAICETFAMGLLGMMAPMVGASLVRTFGGVSVEGIRPLFFIALVGVALNFLLILTQLSNRSWALPGKTRPNFIQDLSVLFKQGRHLKRFIAIGSIGSMEMGLIMPFFMVFANEVKGANELTLGAMATGMSLASLALGIPIGRLADRIGRKKALYLVIPVVCSSFLVLIWAPNPAFLILAGVLHGFSHLTFLITGAMGRELVPPDQMGRWMGSQRFFTALVSAATFYLGGIIWDRIGPQYVFLIAIGLDLVVRIPLLIGMPETLGLRLGTKQSG